MKKEFANLTDVLKLYVTDEGLVRYEALRMDREARDILRGYLDLRAPGNASKEYLAADVVNKYNSLVILATLEHIEEARRNKDGVKGISGFFDGIRYEIGGETCTLQQFESLGSKRTVPEVHFGYNCASLGCPPLMREAYTEENVIGLLRENAQRYLGKKTKVDGRKIRTSDLFFWFPSDFFDLTYIRHPLRFRERLIEYLIRMLPPEHEASTILRKASPTLIILPARDWDWRLNEASVDN